MESYGLARVIISTLPLTTASLWLALPQEMLLCGLNNVLGLWLNKLKYQQNESVLHNTHYLSTHFWWKKISGTSRSFRSASLESAKRSRNEARGETVWTWLQRETGCQQTQGYGVFFLLLKWQACDKFMQI